MSHHPIRSWFDLARHDEGDPDPAAGTDPGTPDPATDGNPPDPSGDPDPDTTGDPAPDDTATDDEAKLGDAGKRAIERMKASEAEAKRKAAEERKARLAAEAKVREYEDRDKSDLDKATAQAERAADQAVKAVARAVSAEIRVGANGRFADPADAVDVLMRNPAQYVDAEGEIDTDAIETALADLLERKPHWAKPEPAPAAPADPEPEKRARPRPDPAQGSRTPPTPTDFRSASKEDLAAELARYGYRQRYS